jgi:glycosyltransferase involved in cell wall biosynthesis
MPLGEDGRPRDVSHVLMTADAVGGVWTFALDLARALADVDVRVSLAVMGPRPSPEQRAEAAAAVWTLREADVKLEWMEDPWADVEEAGRWLLGLEEELAPDIVHLNGYCHGALPWRTPVVVTGHSCVLSWWAAVHGQDAPAAWDRYATEVRRGLAAAGAVTAPSTEMLEALQRYYGPLENARVVPNGRSVTRDSAVPKEPFVFSAGRVWDRAKNVRLVCASAPRIAWPVYVAGDTAGPGGEATRCDGVHFLGRLSSGELLSWMSRAAIYVLPARYEPFGLSVLEAALCGCALVLGDRPSLRELWADAALYVAPDDPRGLEASVGLLIERPQLRDAMAQRAIARARELTPARMAEGYHNTYLELARAIRPVLSLGAV